MKNEPAAHYLPGSADIGRAPARGSCSARPFRRVLGLGPRRQRRRLKDLGIVSTFRPRPYDATLPAIRVVRVHQPSSSPKNGVSRLRESATPHEKHSGSAPRQGADSPDKRPANGQPQMYLYSRSALYLGPTLGLGAVGHEVKFWCAAFSINFFFIFLGG